MKSVSIILIFLFSIAGFALTPDNYTSIPKAKDREKPNSGYVLFEDFSRAHVQIVQEDSGIANPVWASMITDAKLHHQIEQKYFTSLQVRDLGILVSRISFADNKIIFPFAVSVKHSQGSNTSPVNFDKGSIEVAGLIVVQATGTDLKVTVQKFDDSWWLERDGRGYWAGEWVQNHLGYNQDINFDFAKAIVEPILTGFFNQDPARVYKLIAMKDLPPSVQRY